MANMTTGDPPDTEPTAEAPPAPRAETHGPDAPPRRRARGAIRRGPVKRVCFNLPLDLAEALTAYSDNVGIDETACVIVMLRQRLGLHPTDGSQQLELPPAPPTAPRRRARRTTT